MRLSRIGMGALVASGLLTMVPGTASAEPNLRVQVSQHGDFILLGNTFGHECAAGTPPPIVGTVGACDNATADSSPEIFWRADLPVDGAAEANTAITLAPARSTAVLTIPAGASVTHAFLYWAATLLKFPALAHWHGAPAQG